MTMNLNPGSNPLSPGTNLSYYEQKESQLRCPVQLLFVMPLTVIYLYYNLQQNLCQEEIAKGWTICIWSCEQDFGNRLEDNKVFYLTRLITINY